jgi:hypothetical protein
MFAVSMCVCVLCITIDQGEMKSYCWYARMLLQDDDVSAKIHFQDDYEIPLPRLYAITCHWY